MKENNYNEIQTQKFKKKKTYKNYRNEYLIPYYSEKNKFELPVQMNIKHCDLDYISKSIEEINYELINKSNIPFIYKIEKIFTIIFGFILFLVTLYLSMLFVVSIIFNPMIIICFALFIFSNEISWLVHLYFGIKAKSKFANIKNKLNDLNSNSNNTNNKYIWKLGRDFSWITIKINKYKK